MNPGLAARQLFGACVQVEKNVVRWQKWEVRVRFDPREGMILHNITFDHGGSAPRPILHRVSLPEMTVPYADTQPPFHRRQAFGECPVSWGQILVHVL